MMTYFAPARHDCKRLLFRHAVDKHNRCRGRISFSSPKQSDIITTDHCLLIFSKMSTKYQKCNAFHFFVICRDYILFVQTRASGHWTLDSTVNGIYTTHNYSYNIGLLSINCLRIFHNFSFRTHQYSWINAKSVWQHITWFDHFIVNLIVNLIMYLWKHCQDNHV